MVVPAAAAHLAEMSVDVRQMEAVAQILLRKVDTESKYLARLEGKAVYTSVVDTKFMEIAFVTRAQIAA